MAIHYNLAKVFALSDDDPEFVLQIVNLFVLDVPADLEEIREGIKKSDRKHAYAYAHKIKPTLDLLGMKVAFDEILQMEAWAKDEKVSSKGIKEIFKSIKIQVDEAVKELKKDFNI